MKLSKSLVMLFLLGAFFVSVIGGVDAADCNYTGTNIINSTSISANCTLGYFNQVFTMSGETFNLPSTTSGAIGFVAANITLDFNGSIISGNGSTSSYGIVLGSSRHNSTIKNGVIRDYGRGISNSAINLTVDNMTFINYSSVGILSQGNKTLVNNSFFFNSSSVNVYSISLSGSSVGTVITSSNFNKTRGVTCSGVKNLDISNNNFSTLAIDYAVYCLAVTSNITFNSNILTHGQNLVRFENVSNVYTSLNSFYNVSGVATAFYFINSTNITSNLDNLNLVDKAYDIDNVTLFVVNNSMINDSSTSFDGWDTGVFAHKNSSGIINNVTINNSERTGIFIRDNYLSINISNVYINLLGNAEKIDRGDITNYLYPPTGIILGSIYNSWPDFLPANSDTFSNFSGKGVSNVDIRNVTFGSNVQVLMTLQDTSNITYDNSISNYWYKNFAYPMYLFQTPKEYFISNNYNNVTSTRNLATNDLFSIAYANLIKGRYQLFRDYVFLNNSNLTSVSYDAGFYNLTDTLIYNINGTVYGSTNINTNDGNVNITLHAGNSSYVLDNFNLTEGVTRSNSPLWYISASNSRKEIGSNLTDIINTTVVFNVTSCNTVGNIIYTSHTGTYRKTYRSGDYSCANNQVTLVLENIEPASSSNEIQIDYDATGQIIQPFNLRELFLVTFAESSTIFTFLAFLIISIGAARFRMPNIIYLTMLLLFTVIMSLYIDRGIYILGIVTAGFIAFYSTTKMWKT